MVKRNRIVRVRLTEEQLNRLLREAELEGLTVSQLVRRHVFYHGKQYKRPYTVKHAKRTGKPTLEQIRQYIAQHPELIQQNIEQNPSGQAQPKTMEELALMVARNSVEIFWSSMKEFLPMVFLLRKTVKSRIAKLSKQEESVKDFDKKLESIKSKIDSFEQLFQLYQAYLKMQEERRV